MSSVKLKKQTNVVAVKKKADSAMSRIDVEVKVLKWVIYVVTAVTAVISYLLFGSIAKAAMFSLLSFFITVSVGVIAAAVFNVMWR